MKKLYSRIILLGALVLAALASCTNIPQDQRLIEVKETKAEGRTILLEDFTGVHCVNCPQAAKIIHEIQELYGNKVVAVGLHGAEAFTPKSSPLFSNDAAAYYQKFANGVGLPAGMIDRKAFDGNKTPVQNSPATWAGLVKRELALPQLLSIEASASGEGENTVKATVTVNAIKGANLPSSMKLQVWVIENGIIGEQDGAEDKYNYQHNHVLRGTLNGTWGEALELGKTYTYSKSIKNIEDIEGCQVVSFVYDAETMEVLEANVVDLKN